MAYELKDGQGNLFRNDKGDNPKRPDMRGEVMIAGTIYALSGWVYKGKGGKADWLSLKAQVKEDRGRTRPQQAGDVDSRDHGQVTPETATMGNDGTMVDDGSELPF